ncbi:SurA N-terminal domain-containing protein [Candidatus Daviesbacteria bacterium]|nr:SurA N-terminal domain-containing protein [Candidatus Daviesbacteria bacterium]
MPKKVKSVKITANPINSSTNFLMALPERIISYRPSKKVSLILLAAGILLLAVFKKEWFIAATVNGSLITNLEVQMKLNQQFKNQILTQLINEKLILSEAAKMGTLPSDAEIDAKVAEVEARLGGTETLNSLLAQQNASKETFRNQLKLELAITKLYEKEATFSAEELQKFMEDNKNVLQSTDSASLQKEASDMLRQQKLSQIFNQKFQELKEKANIQIF